MFDVLINVENFYTIMIMIMIFLEEVSCQKSSEVTPKFVKKP